MWGNVGFNNQLKKYDSNLFQGGFGKWMLFRRNKGHDGAHAEVVLDTVSRIFYVPLFPKI